MFRTQINQAVDPAIAVPAVRLGEIEVEMNRAHDLMGFLHSEIDLLVDALGPVLSPAAPAGDSSKGEPEPTTTIGSNLRSLRNAINHAAQRIVEARARLEL